MRTPVIGLDSSALEIYLEVEPCDRRMGVNGVAAAATERLSEAFSLAAIFAFSNKRRGVQLLAALKLSGFLSLCPCHSCRGGIDSARPLRRMGT